MTSFPLTLEERAASGFTHKFVIAWDDADVDVAATAATIALITVPARTLIAAAAFSQATVFTDGAATMSNLTLELGWNSATGNPTDDPNGLIEAAELEVTGTEILSGDATGVAFATKRTGLATQESTIIEAVLTATGANLSTLTAGEVAIFLKIVDLGAL